MIAPIETTWNGYRFRSRTEARWAVFFSAAGIRAEYEKEGHKLPSGWYLPDFWLPVNEHFIEVKGQSPTNLETARCQELALAACCPVLLVVGAPDPQGDLILFGPNGNVETSSQWYFYGAGAATEQRIGEYTAAYATSRAERFDGSAQPPDVSSSLKRPEWW
jgi:hypothetical protein